MNSWKKSLALLLLLVAGAVYAYKVEYQGAKKKEETERKEKKIFSFDEKSITKLAITTKDGKVEAARDKDGWKITAPVATDGDAVAIGGVIAAAIDSYSSETTEGDPKDFGLEPADTQVDFYVGEKPVTLLVGAHTPTGSAVYVKTGGKIMLAPASIADAVGKNLYQLREKRLFNGTATEITKLEIWRGKTLIAAEKGTDGRWGMTSPAKSEADEGVIMDLLSSLIYSQAISFADDKSETETGLKNPSIKISIWKKNAAQTLLIGDETKDKLSFHAKIEGGKSTAVLPAMIIRKLPQTAQELAPRK